MSLYLGLQPIVRLTYHAIIPFEPHTKHHPPSAWIFQIDGTFGITAGKRITLAGGALSKNIVWVVAGAIDFGAGAHFEGIILAKTSVTVETGGSGNGRILAQTSVSLQSATITKPA